MCDLKLLSKEGKFLAVVEGKQTPAYKKWNSIKNRLQAPHKRGNASYHHCTLSEEWKDFQNFAKWYYENFVEGWVIDKDLLSSGVKTYSSETCCFIPPKLNGYLVGMSRVLDGDTSLCWNYRENYKVYVANVSNNKKRIHLGHYTNAYDASVAYLKGKFEILNSIEEEYSQLFSQKVVDGLKNFREQLMSAVGCTQEDIRLIDEKKLKRKERFVRIEGEYIPVVKLAETLGMRYRTLYPLIYLKKWPLRSILDKYDKQALYKDKQNLEIDYYD